MSSDQPVVRHASAADITPIARSLAEAFHDDPVKAHLIGGKSVSVEKAMPFFVGFQQIQLPHGHVYTTTGHEAAAIWAPPGHWKIPLSQIVRKSPMFLRLYGWRFVPNLGVLTTIERVHGEQCPEPHYYLEFIGTAPPHQGKGLGSLLIKPMIERADVEGVPMWLESSKALNVPFYSRFGFEVVHEIQLRKGPMMWAMKRAPR